jgi:hypothetical protein
MATTTDISETPGLPLGGKPVESPARTGSDLIDAAAAGDRLAPQESDDLLAYFLTNQGLPGDTEVTALSVELGHGQSTRKFSCEVKAVEWSEWQDAIERATNEKTGGFDRFVSSSWVVARALVTPKLGPTIVRMQSENSDTAPADAAALLRRMFRKQSGALLELAAKVLELSKLANDGESSVKEIEAGKD